MYHWGVENKNIVFYLSDNSDEISLENWGKVEQGIHYSKYLLLCELADNGIAEIQNNRVIVALEEILILPTNDKKVLELPENYPFEIRINADGDLGQANFKYNWFFCEHEYGQELTYSRESSFLISDGRYLYTLSSDQYKLCEELDEFNTTSSEVKSLQYNLLKFATIKELAQKSEAILHPYLINENVIAPDQLKLKLRKDADDLELIPEVEGVDSDKFENTFDRYPTEKEIYTTSDEDGNRKRIVFNPSLKNELGKIKKYRRVSGEKKDYVIDRPNEIFDPELIDLDLFSSRVVEIGLYKPRFYSFVSPYKSQWLPGFVVEKSPTEKINIKFKEKRELDDFKLHLKAAKTTENEKFEWKGNEIPIEDAKSIIEVAEKQFAKPNTPVKSESNSGTKVLIIIENVEELGYEEKNDFDLEFTHLFHTPPNLKKDVHLLDHQIEGIAWLQTLCNKNIPGCLLADDMGLGKTLQVLSFIDWHNKEHNNLANSYLIVAPVSLLENWQIEYDKFFSPTIPEMHALYGSGLRKLDNMQIDEAVKWLSQNKIILTTYETLRSKSQFILGAVGWESVFLDEAQRIKTPGTLVTNAAKAIKSQFKVAMTGTPVENSLMDLWCIMDFSVPGLLSSAKEFATKYHPPTFVDSEAMKKLGEELRESISIHIKRRFKKDILTDLPSKKEIKLEHPMPGVQLERYELEVENIKNEFDGIDNSRGRMLKYLSTIKDISDHPFIPERELDNYNIDELVDSSAKLQITFNLLKDIRSRKEKVLIFAERRETQRLLQKLLLNKFNLNASIVNGDTPARISRISSSKLSRQGTIDKFQNLMGFNAIIMSPIAAGLGLNITGANNVIHYSRHWNPAKEDQATDRAYRIGQTKDVNVYYPLATAPNFKSFDLVLDAHISRKRKLSATTLFPTDQAEVNPFDIFNDLNSDEDVSSKIKPFTIEDLDNLNPYSFEAAAAAIWGKMNFEVILTPRANDKGADVIALSDKENHLIQVKHTKTTIGDNAVGEILKAEGYYKNKYVREFKLSIVTNGKLTQNAKELALANNVIFYGRNELIEKLKEFNITLNDVLGVEKNRAY